MIEPRSADRFEGETAQCVSLRFTYCDAEAVGRLATPTGAYEYVSV
jgi:hypothetical protein